MKYLQQYKDLLWTDISRSQVEPVDWTMNISRGSLVSAYADTECKTGGGLMYRSFIHPKLYTYTPNS